MSKEKRIELEKLEPVKVEALYMKDYDFVLFVTRYGDEDACDYVDSRVGVNMVRGLNIHGDLKFGWAAPDVALSEFVNMKMKFSVNGTMSQNTIDRLAEIVDNYCMALFIHQQHNGQP